MENFITKRFNFSAGEVHIVTNVGFETNDEAEITANLRSSDDIMALLLTTDALRRQGVTDISLCMPYVPYSRQDRVVNEGEAHGLKVFCNLINSQNYSHVHIWDPHSDVTSALLNNVNIIEQHELVTMSLDVSNDVLVCPDSGARKKILKLAQKCLSPVVFADKTRNTKTGGITGTILSEVPKDWDLSKDHLVVDDILDGGRTFVEVGNALKAKGVTGSIGLYVTHAIFSKGASPLNGIIDTVYTDNCWLSEDEIRKSNSENLTQIVVL